MMKGEDVSPKFRDGFDIV